MHVSNSKVRDINNCQLLSYMVTDKKTAILWLCCVQLLHSRPSPGSLSGNLEVATNWRRPVGRPRHTWLRAVESDLRPLNIGLSSA